MVLLDHLGQRWTLRILWELRAERMTFRELQANCGKVSPTVLNKRLKELRELQLIDHAESGYGLTQYGRELAEQLAGLDNWARTWATLLER